MGGSFILAGLLVVCLLWINISHPLVWGALLIIYGFALVGLWDDLIKIRKENFRGLPPRWRLLLEFLLCSIILSVLVYLGHLSTVLYIPVFKNVSFDMGWTYVLFASFVITGCANGVNLTDGLDGLAVFPVLVCSATLAVFSYCAGHFEIASYLGIPFVQGAGELTPLAAAVVSGCLGFLMVQLPSGSSFSGRHGFSWVGKLFRHNSSGDKKRNPAHAFRRAFCGRNSFSYYTGSVF